MVFIPHDSEKTNNNFPDSLTLSNKPYPIPAIHLEETATDITPLFTYLDIFVSPKQKFSDIFKETSVSFKSAKQARRWLSGPDFRYWSQQLNFAVWCATSGCGISLREAEKYPARPVCSQPFANSTLPRPSLDAGAGSSTHQSPVSRLVTVCQSYTEAGVSESTQNLLLAVWRKGTSDTYASAWRKWACWCSALNINPVQAAISF